MPSYPWKPLNEIKHPSSVYCRKLQTEVYESCYRLFCVDTNFTTSDKIEIVNLLGDNIRSARQATIEFNNNHSDRKEYKSAVKRSIKSSMRKVVFQEICFEPGIMDNEEFWEVVKNFRIFKDHLPGWNDWFRISFLKETTRIYLKKK